MYAFQASINTTEKKVKPGVPPDDTPAAPMILQKHVEYLLNTIEEQGNLFSDKKSLLYLIDNEKEIEDESIVKSVCGIE